MDKTRAQKLDGVCELKQTVIVIQIEAKEKKLYNLGSG